MRLDVDMHTKLWRSYRSWQRLERKWLSYLPGQRPAALLTARAIAIQEYLDVRDECVRKASAGEPQQMEMAR